MQETWVPSLGWEDPLEKEMATHISILVWRIPCTEEPGELQSAAAAAKLLQSCSTLCDPIDGSPPGSPVPGIPKEMATHSSVLAWRVLLPQHSIGWERKL